MILEIPVLLQAQVLLGLNLDIIRHQDIEAVQPVAFSMWVPRDTIGILSAAVEPTIYLLALSSTTRQEI